MWTGNTNSCISRARRPNTAERSHELSHCSRRLNGRCRKLSTTPRPERCMSSQRCNTVGEEPKTHFPLEEDGTAVRCAGGLISSRLAGDRVFERAARTNAGDGVPRGYSSSGFLQATWNAPGTIRSTSTMRDGQRWGGWTPPPPKRDGRLSIWPCRG